MMTPKRLQALANLMIISLLCLCIFMPQPARAQAGTPDEMHQAINNLRAANGLPPLAVNSYLVQAAQNHASWIAAGNPGGHTGINGSSPYDRALAVGYGEGAQIWVTENWARGPGLTVQDCIYVSWNDAAHMNNMLTTWHNEFGAGVALDGAGMTVYVVDFGHSGDSLPVEQSTATPGGPTFTPSAPTNTPEPLIQPVLTSTPNPDGSVIHVVQSGQSLWSIADGYDIPMVDLLTMNNLTEESIILTGQELLVMPASIAIQDTESVVEIQSEDLTPSPSPTFTPTTQVTSTPTVIPTPTEEPQAEANFFTNIFSGDTLWLSVGLIGVTVVGVALLLFTSSRLK
jgi:LysM repeat protein